MIEEKIRKILNIKQTKFNRITKNLGSERSKKILYNKIRPECKRLVIKSCDRFKGNVKRRYSDAGCFAGKRFIFPFKPMGFRFKAIVHSVRPPGADVCAGSPSVEYYTETHTPYDYHVDYYNGWNGFGDIDEAMVHAVTRACVDTLAKN